jgi:integrase
VLRQLLHAGDTGEHVTPDKKTLAQWVEHWVSIRCPGNKRRREVGQRGVERYAELLRCHVVPPMLELAKVPSPGEADHGMVLDTDQLEALIQGFKGSALFEIVAMAVLTGARRNEILALRWFDLDAEKKTLRIERAIEETEAHGLSFKGPKTERGKRTFIAI